MESFWKWLTTYGYGGQDKKAGTAEGEGTTMVQTSGNIRDFHFSGDKKYMLSIFYKSRTSDILHSI